jgi:hypothetical protein
MMCYSDEEDEKELNKSSKCKSTNVRNESKMNQL